MNDTAPCPWCEKGAKTFLYLSRKPFMSYTVQCSTCFSRGPHVVFDPNSNRRKTRDEISAPAKIEATKRWNEMCKRIHGDNDEKSG